MLTTILIDDEPINNSILSAMLEEFCPQVQVVGQATCAEDALALIGEKKPDLLFLDIQMPGQNGFALLNRLMPAPPEVIFVTAFDSYAMNAIRHSALDYLLKPLNIAELQESVEKAKLKLQLKSSRLQLENLLANLGKPAGLKKIALPSREGYEFISISRIIRLEASKGYSIFHLHQGSKLTTSRHIKEYEEILPAEVFFRVHHSHLINLNFVKKYHRGRGGYLEMEDGSLVEVAARRKEEFLRQLGHTF